MKRSLLTLLLLAMLVFVAACGGGSDEPASSATTPAASSSSSGGTQAEQPAPAATATPVPPTPTPVPPTATPEPEEEPLSAEQLAALEALDSYRLVVNFSSVGTDADSNPIDDSGEIIIEYTKEPPARRMVIGFVDNTDPAAEQESIETFQIGQDMYMYGGEETGWMRIATEESPFDDPDLAMLSSGDIFTNLEEMKRVRPDEEINGIDSRHYTFDEKVLERLFLEPGGDVTATGDVWIAKDGGFVTKYVLTIQVNDGNGGMLDPNMANGTLEMSFELQDVNSDIQIELPEEATAGLSLAGFEDQEFPAPPGSTTQMAGGQMVVLQTEAPIEEVIAFYETTLADMGWTKDEQGSMSFEGMSSLSFTKDGATLSVLITSDDSTGLTQIMANTE